MLLKTTMTTQHVNREIWKKFQSDKGSSSVLTYDTFLFHASINGRRRWYLDVFS